MIVKHGGLKTDHTACDREIVKQQLIVLGIIMLWLVVSAFLLSGCPVSQEPDTTFDSTLADTSGDATETRIIFSFQGRQF